MNNQRSTDMAANVMYMTSMMYHNMNPANLQVPSFTCIVLPNIHPPLAADSIQNGIYRRAITRCMIMSEVKNIVDGSFKDLY